MLSRTAHISYVRLDLASTNVFGIILIPWNPVGFGGMPAFINEPANAEPFWFGLGNEDKMDQLGLLELIREALIAVVHEMRANVIQSSYSSVIYEGHDFSCALLTADGRHVAQSDGDTPVHIIAVPYSAREVIRTFNDDIHEGDVFLHNDPYTGGTHLNDILMLHPVFSGGKLVLFAAIRYHWADVGGMTAGSLSGQAKEIYQEGMRITPTRICEKGVMNETFLRLLVENMRLPAERMGDFNAMYGTGRKAEEHVQRLLLRFGPDSLLEAIEEILTRSENVMRERIRSLKDGDYYAEGYMESDGVNPEPLVARLKLTIKGDEMIADFTGTSAQAAGPTNVGPSMTLTSLGSITKSFLDPYTPINHGSFEPITIIAPEGTMVNARHPAPCGGMVEVKALMDTLVATTLGQVVPEMKVGDLKGGANHIYTTGRHIDREDIFILYEWPSGGTGASDSLDGNNCVRQYNEGDFNSLHAIEVVESQYPLRIERSELRVGSCGDGKYRGGLGLRRDLRLLGQAGQLSVLTDKCVIPPIGVHGAANAAANNFVVVRDDEIVQPSPIPGKVSGFPLHEGDIVRYETAGGGGYGDPLERDLERVADDVRHGYITAHIANIRYGVVIAEDGAVDATATDERRAELQDARIHLTLEAANEDTYAENRRVFRVPSKVATLVGAAEGDLVEIFAGTGPLVRGWVALDDSNGESAMRVGPDALHLLAAAPGDAVEIRPVRREPLA